MFRSIRNLWGDYVRNLKMNVIDFQCNPGNPCMTTSATDLKFNISWTSLLSSVYLLLWSITYLPFKHNYGFKLFDNVVSWEMKYSKRSDICNKRNVLEILLKRINISKPVIMFYRTYISFVGVHYRSIYFKAGLDVHTTVAKLYVHR